MKKNIKLFAIIPAILVVVLVAHSCARKKVTTSADAGLLLAFDAGVAGVAEKSDVEAGSEEASDESGTSEPSEKYAVRFGAAACIPGTGTGQAQDATAQCIAAKYGLSIPIGGTGTGLCQDATLQAILGAIPDAGGGGGGTPSGPAGGDLSGTYPNPLVASISGSTPILITPNVLEWTAGTTTPTLSQATSTTGSGQNLLIQSQGPLNSGTHSPGDIVLSTPAPISTGAAGAVDVQSAGTAYVQLGVSNSSYGALWLGNLSRSSNNEALLGNGTATYVNASGAVYVSFNNGVYTAFGTSSVQFAQAALQWTNSVGSATSITTAALASTSAGSGAAGYATTLSGQAGQAATGASNNGGAGGTITLSGGAGGTSGSATAGIGGFVGLASGVTLKTTQVSASSYAVDTNSTTSDLLILTDSTSNAITVTLPTPTAGRYLCVKDRTGEAATHNVTVSHHASETIDGASTIVFTKNYDAVCVASNGTNWSVVSEFSSSIVP